MSDYYEFVEKYLGVTECIKSKKYCDIGHTFYLSNAEFEGVYWFYESEHFIIDIHDFFIKQEIVNTNYPDLSKFMSVYSSYIITANGESFNPYQTISANSVYVLDMRDLDASYRFLLHANSPYLGIGVSFKNRILEEYISAMINSDEVSCYELFINTRAIITKSLEPLAKDILNCKMPSPAAKIFFEAKAKEWISLIIDAFLSNRSINISIEDDEAIENVASYLDDHYALNTSQKTLEKIAMMSGTKLKKLFKQKYQFSITEYTQRRRMNIAEILLLNTPLKIKEIAETVGYSSHSKFSACFKRYKGIYPREMRQYVKSKRQNSN